MNPTFSIVITSFNHDKFIGATLESALADAGSDVEVIVVDDGSTDNTISVLDSFSSPSLRVIRLVNGGVSAALNKGIAAARGDYIALCGSDDIRHPGSLAASRNELDLTSSDFVFCRPRLINEIGIELRTENFPIFHSHSIDKINFNPLDYLFTNGNVYCASSVLGRRNSFYKNGLFNEALLQLQDYDYWLRAAMRGQKIYLSPTGWKIDYRVHKGNLSSNKNNNRMLLEERAIFEWISADKDLVSQGITNLSSYLPLTFQHGKSDLIYWTWCLLQNPRASIREIGYILASKILSEDKNAFLKVNLKLNDVWMIASK